MNFSNSLVLAKGAENKITDTFLQIFEYFSRVSLDTASGALARLRFGDLAKPVQSAIIDSFGNIESKIETAMVAATQDEHELSRFMFHFGQFQFRIFPFQNIRIYQGGFVTQVLGTLTEMFREMHAGFFL